jgi:N-methylhydantoinase B
MKLFDPISLGILWDRLISITDEILNALVRTSFSTNVRESYDLSCVIFDSKGSSLAQGTYSVPSFTGTAPPTMMHILHRFPPATLRPGDVIATNDPWMGTGHLFDISVVRPVFRREQLIGFSMSITHLPDIGGRGFSATATQVYEEGLRLPICKLVREGKLNDELIDLISTNVRVPEQVIGDLKANITCNEVGGRLLIEFMDEYGIDDLTPLSKAIINLSEKTLREKIEQIPDGIYDNRIAIEGVGDPLILACQVNVKGDEIRIGCEGTSPAIPIGINVPICYSKAFAAYAIKCLTIPSIPNNEGCINPIFFSAPDGCILNARPPFPTGGRHVIGHFVTPLVFGALAEAMPDRVQADSGMLNLMNFQGTNREGKGISTIYYASGGFGALDGMDGADVTPSPSNMTGTPIEVWENLTGMTIIKKALVADSGGPGRYRGGLGQETVLKNSTGHPLVVSCLAARTEFPPLGIHGGKSGQLRQYTINGEPVHPKGRYILNPGDVITATEAGGGGFGNAYERSTERVLHDVQYGFVTKEGAVQDYGVEVAMEQMTGNRIYRDRG